MREDERECNACGPFDLRWLKKSVLFSLIRGLTCTDHTDVKRGMRLGRLWRAEKSIAWPAIRRGSLPQSFSSTVSSFGLRMSSMDDEENMCLKEWPSIHVWKLLIQCIRAATDIIDESISCVVQKMSGECPQGWHPQMSCFDHNPKIIRLYCRRGVKKPRNIHT